MSDRAANDALFDEFAEVAKALSSGRRGEIVGVLAQGERSVEQVAGEIDQSVANTSHHLRASARAGLLTTPEVVAYCRSPYCVYADDAVRELRRRGCNASRLEDGYPEWERAGLPVAAGQ
jgi:DNA-binding transcriptional ArsR family regulator